MEGTGGGRIYILVLAPTVTQNPGDTFVELAGVAVPMEAHPAISLSLPTL